MGDGGGGGDFLGQYSLPSCQSTKQLQPIRRHNVLHEKPTVAALFCQQAIKALPSLISCMVSFDVKQR